MGGATTAYVGNYFEWTGSTSTMVKYYYAGSQRVAMRQGSTLYWLLSDHLGSANLVANSSGQEVSGSRTYYAAFGDTRYGGGSLPTDRRFTGQQRVAALGLYYYGARWYDSSLGRFLSADTIVPSPGNPQSLNRYSYVLGNPLRLVDPSGHCGTTPGGGQICATGQTLSLNVSPVDPTLSALVMPDTGSTIGQAIPGPIGAAVIVEYEIPGRTLLRAEGGGGAKVGMTVVEFGVKRQHVQYANLQFQPEGSTVEEVGFVNVGPFSYENVDGISGIGIDVRIASLQANNKSIELMFGGDVGVEGPFLNGGAGVEHIAGQYRRFIVPAETWSKLGDQRFADQYMPGASLVKQTWFMGGFNESGLWCGSGMNCALDEAWWNNYKYGMEYEVIPQ